MTACLDETAGARLIAGELPPDEAEVAHRHVAACRECEQFLAELARVAVSSTRTDSAEPQLDTDLRRGAMVGRFLVLGRIGSGGMGVVYAAYDPELDRRVALKLLRGASASGDVRARLLREAQAAARLSHPNVVAVFDIGVFEDRVYLAMEHVDGVTLAEWLRTERSWEDVVGIFVQAGRGIAAAHEAGVIHRDFKPDNVLVGRDGRARVVDFGLARAADAITTPGGVAADGDPDETQPASGGIAARVTQTGALLGTPRYMAPEQFADGEITPATDQFGFSVALYQALYGTPPFRGDRISEIATHVLDGDVTPPAANRGPLALRRAIVRGLAVEPARRHASMAALLRELEHTRSLRRRRLVVAFVSGAIIAVAVAAVLLTIAVRDEPAASPCTAADEQLVGVWNAERARGVAESFRATHAPFAADAFDHVAAQLDRYSSDWTAMYTDACRATHELGKQSPQLLDRRMMCLDRRRASLRELGDVLLEADTDIVRRSADAVSALDPIARCGDLEALSATVPPPADPITRSRVDAIAQDLAQAKALLDTGSHVRGLDIARRAVRAAGSMNYAQIDGEANLVLAELENASGHLKDAERQLDHALRAAALARDDDLAARVWITIVRVIGYSSGRLPAVEALTKAADAAVLRAGATAALQGDYEHVLGSVAITAGDPARARRHFEASLRIREQSPAGNGPRIATLLNNIGNTYAREGSYDRARTFLVRALEMRRELLGQHHPQLAESLNGIGALELMRGDLEAARDPMTRALAIWQAALGPEHPSVATAHVNLGTILRERGDVAQAIEHHDKALAIGRKTLGDRHPKVAAALDHLADDYKVAKQHARAAGAYREAIAIFTEAYGASHPRVGEVRGRLGESLAALGDHRAAIAELTAWLASVENRVGAEHPDLVWPLAMLGGVMVDAGDRRGAIPLGERAVALATKSNDAKATATAKFQLGRALWASDRARARRLVETARVEFARAPLGADGVVDADAWLRNHTIH